jgi:peptidoglycan/LPS O-acetylase OafA/YrhL
MAALSIVVLHMPRIFGDFGLPVASLAVDLFFCLSGFVLAHAYSTRFAAGMSPLRFMVARFIRLYPLYLLGTLLGIVEALAILKYQQGSVEWTWEGFYWAIPYSLLMIPNPFANTLFPFNGVMWSIFFELLINLVWVLFWRPLRSQRLLIAVIIVSGLAFAGIGFYRNSVNLGLDWHSFVGGFARVSYGFFTGVLLYRLRDRLSLPKLPPILLLLAVPALFAIPLPRLLQIGAALFVLPWFVALGARVEPSGILARFSHMIGLASYAVYALHRRVFLLGYGFLLQFAHWDAQTVAPWAGLVFIVLIVGGATLLDKIYDNPVRRLMTRLAFGSRDRRATASGAADAVKTPPA